jgi:hypothetical protein
MQRSEIGRWWHLRYQRLICGLQAVNPIAAIVIGDSDTIYASLHVSKQPVSGLNAFVYGDVIA